MEIYNLTASEIEEKIKNKELTSYEVTKSFIDRIKNVDDKIGAYVTVLEEKALKSAKEYDQIENKEKVLFGVPIAIKDNIVSHGDLTTAASKMLSNYVGTYDATVITKIKENNMPIIGKLNMDEFAMGSSNENSAVKTVSNPWDLDRVPGGSSGGSAAAVAASEISISLGSDTGGSVRQPAALSGVVGIKPTYGRVSRYGLMAFSSSLDQIGMMAKTTEDLSKISEVISGYDEKDATSAKVPVPEYSKLLEKSIKGLKIGLPKEYFSDMLDEKIKENIFEAVEVLKKLGAEFKEVSLPHTEYGISSYYIISAAEAASNLSRYDGVRYGLRGKGDNIEEMYLNSRTEGFGDEVKRRIMIGNNILSSGFFDTYYKKASQIRRLIKNDFENVFKEVDVLLAPTTPTVAFKKNEKTKDPVKMYLADIFTVSVSLAGIPAISVPSGFINGLPTGIQIIADYFREDLLFNVSHLYEKERGKIEYPKL